MIRINIFYNTGTKNGQAYKVAHTLDFGYDLSVAFSRNSEKQLVQWDAQAQTYFVVYDPAKAGMRTTKSGYLELVIGG